MTNSNYVVSANTFSYVCEYTGKTIVEKIDNITEDGFVSCESCAHYDRSFVESCGVEISSVREINLREMLSEIENAGLSETYEAALPIADAPLSSMGLSPDEESEIRAAYRKLQNSGFRFVCGELTRKNKPIK